MSLFNTMTSKKGRNNNNNGNNNNNRLLKNQRKSSRTLRPSMLLLFLPLLTMTGDCVYGRVITPVSSYKSTTMNGVHVGGGEIDVDAGNGAGLAGMTVGNDLPVASQLLLTQYLNSNVDDAGFYNPIPTNDHRRPNYMAKWPSLKDLLLTPSDYINGLDNEELLNLHFLERLQQMAENSAGDMIEDARDESRNQLSTSSQLPNSRVDDRSVAFKQHGTKKNVQYMSPCHFKICNMGRKRNAIVFGEY